jgi:hypothetical protein
LSAGQIDGKFFEESGKLFAASTDEAWRLVDCQFEVGWVILAGFLEPFGPVADAAGHDQRLRLRPGGGEAAGNEEFVEALLHGNGLRFMDAFCDGAS